MLTGKEMEGRNSYRIYDHRLKAVVAASGRIDLFPELGIPRSTAWTWLNSGLGEVVTHEAFDQDTIELQKRVAGLEQENAALRAEADYLKAVKEATGWSIDYVRFPEKEVKQRLLGLIDATSSVIPVGKCLETIGMSYSRYYSWRRREAGCELEDHPSCPHTSPTRLTPEEVRTMGEMVQADEYAHFTIRALALYAMRIGKLAASATTWYKLAREKGWARPRKRVYPEKPKVGIRATRPNEIWHVDTTVLKLLDGTRAFIQAVIDNFSRYILAWQVSSSLTGLGSYDLLRSALSKAIAIRPGDVPLVICDSGSENVNAEVDRLIDAGQIIRQIALVEIDFSNSMVEALFRSSKHQYLFFQDLSSLPVSRQHIDFYFQQHNEVMPHAAFRGPTPEEVYRGEWHHLIEQAIPHELAAARQTRLDYHRGLERCGICEN